MAIELLIMWILGASSSTGPTLPSMRTFQFSYIFYGAPTLVSSARHLLGTCQATWQKTGFSLKVVYRVKSTAKKKAGIHRNISIQYKKNIKIYTKISATVPRRHEGHGHNVLPSLLPLALGPLADDLLRIFKGPPPQPIPP